jgi:hypothetical protein
MSSWAKVITLVLVTIFFVTALHSSVTNAQITQFYGGGYYGPTSYENYCAFYITMYSPVDETVYVDTMPLEFNITWAEYPKCPFPVAPPLNGYYAYSIDDGPFASVAATPSPSDLVYRNLTINPTFSCSVDISNLEKGYHKLVINASLYFSNNYPPKHFHFNMTTSPYKFLVGETTATPP